MLILERAIGESVDIGVDVEIKIIQVYGNKVKLGFFAPKDTCISRRELTPVMIPEKKKYNITGKWPEGEDQVEYYSFGSTIIVYF